MKFWKRRKKEPENHLSIFLFTYQGDLVFGVSAESSQEAEAIICEEVFHNQTIPGFPNIVELDREEVRRKFRELNPKNIEEKGIWHQSHS